MMKAPTELAGSSQRRLTISPLAPREGPSFHGSSRGVRVNLFPLPSGERARVRGRDRMRKQRLENSLSALATYGRHPSPGLRPPSPRAGRGIIHSLSASAYFERLDDLYLRQKLSYSS